MFERRRHVDLFVGMFMVEFSSGGGQSRGSAIPRETEMSMS